LAKQAIDGGKVHGEGHKLKASKEIQVGIELTIRQGFDEKIVTVMALSDKRGGAPQAQLLYQETAASIAKREDLAGQRKALRGIDGLPAHRPNKKERRQIHRFQRINQDEEH